MPEPAPAASAGRTLVIVGPEQPGEAIVRAAAALGLTLKTVTTPAGVNPFRSGYAAGQLAGRLKASQADLVHCIGDNAILVGGTAATMAGIGRRIYSPSTPVPAGSLVGMARAFARKLMRALATPQTIYVFASLEDARLYGFGAAEPRVAIVPAHDEAGLQALYERTLAA